MYMHKHTHAIKYVYVYARHLSNKRAYTTNQETTIILTINRESVEMSEIRIYSSDRVQFTVV